MSGRNDAPAIALLVKIDGTTEDVDLGPDGKHLQIMHEVIGCQTVTALTVDAVDIWLDDDGEYGQEYNPFVQYVVMSLLGESAIQPFFGPALLAGFTAQGRTVSLKDADRQRITGVIRKIRPVVGIGAHRAGISGGRWECGSGSRNVLVQGEKLELAFTDENLLVLPVDRGWRVLVRSDDDGTFSVFRAQAAGARNMVIYGKRTGVTYADLGETAYQASCFVNVTF